MLVSLQVPAVYDDRALCWSLYSNARTSNCFGLILSDVFGTLFAFFYLFFCICTSCCFLLSKSVTYMSEFSIFTGGLGLKTDLNICYL